MVRQQRNDYRRRHGITSAYRLDPLDIDIMVRRIWEGESAHIDHTRLSQAVQQRLEQHPEERHLYNTVYDGPLSAKQLAKALGVTPRTVVRRRAKTRRDTTRRGGTQQDTSKELQC